MSKKIDPHLVELLKKYGEDNGAVWDCHGTWVAYHAAIERMAAKAGIEFQLPTIVRDNADIGSVCIMVPAKLGERLEWSFGEVSKANNKNAYPYAMAEKRAKDRVALKLLGMAGLIYSEEEADDFKDSKPDGQHEYKPQGDVLEGATRSSSDLKKNKEWEGLLAEYEPELADVKSVIKFDALAKYYLDRAKGSGWKQDWIDQLRGRFIADRIAIQRRIEQQSANEDAVVAEVKNGFGGRVVDERVN